MKTLSFALSLATILTSMGCSNASTNSRSEAQPEDEIVEKVEVNDTLLHKSQVSVDGIEFNKLIADPHNSYVTMVDSVIPNINDSTIALCVEAAFTGELLKEFKSTNVGGDYVIDGVKHRGYKCKANTGFLVTFNGHPTISSLDNLKDHLETKETLFQQLLLINGGADVYTGKPIKPSSENIYRAACIMSDGGFTIIQSVKKISLQQFIDSLIKLGVNDALYLDMGKGWNYGWYRETMGSPATKFFDFKSPYQTNWLVIKARDIK